MDTVCHLPSTIGYLASNNFAFDMTIGTKVEKVKGYSFPGTVVAVFETTKGETRLVVEMDGYGLLHIFSPENLVERV